MVDNINIKIGSSDINVVSSVTNLDVKLDRNLKMTAQASHLMSSCAQQLKLVNSIRASLNVQVSERVVNIQTRLLQFFVGWPYSTGFYPPAKIIERRCKICTDVTTGF